MMQELLDRSPDWRVMLVADSDVQRFYRKAGFDEYASVMVRLAASRLYDVTPGPLVRHRNGQTKPCS